MSDRWSQHFLSITSLRSPFLCFCVRLREGEGARVATLIFWGSPPQRSPPSSLEEDLVRQGMYLLKAADCTLVSLNFLTAASTDVPKSPEGESGISRRKFFSFFPMSAKLNHRCSTSLCGHHCHLRSKVLSAGSNDERESVNIRIPQIAHACSRRSREIPFRASP